MKRKTISIILTLALSVVFAIPALAMPPEIIDEITIGIPYGDADKELMDTSASITFTKVYDTWHIQYYYGIAAYMYVFVLDRDGTVCFSDDTALYLFEEEEPDMVCKAGIPYSIRDISGHVFSHSVDGSDEYPGAIVFYSATDPEWQRQMGMDNLRRYRVGDSPVDGFVDEWFNFSKVTKFALDNQQETPDSPPPDAPPTADMPSTWAAELVNAAIAADLVPQTLRTKYTQPTTRAEFAALAVTLYENVTGKEIATTRSMPFTDTTDINAIKAAAIGVTTGTGDGTTFSPDLALTREQAATMLSRLADALEKPLPDETATFADVASVSTWAVEAVGQMQTTGVMGGVGENKFAPKDPYTREQSIMTIMRLYEIVS